MDLVVWIGDKEWWIFKDWRGKDREQTMRLERV